MNALVALVERKSGLRPIDADPRRRRQIGRRPQGRRLVFVAIPADVLPEFIVESVTPFLNLFNFIVGKKGRALPEKLD